MHRNKIPTFSCDICIWQSISIIDIKGNEDLISAAAHYLAQRETEQQTMKSRCLQIACTLLKNDSHECLLLSFPSCHCQVLLTLRYKCLEVTELNKTSVNSTPIANTQPVHIRLSQRDLASFTQASIAGTFKATSVSPWALGLFQCSQASVIIKQWMVN